MEFGTTNTIFWEWNVIPTDFHSIIFQRGKPQPPSSIKLASDPLHCCRPRTVMTGYSYLLLYTSSALAEASTPRAIPFTASWTVELWMV